MINYIENFIKNPDEVMKALVSDLDWEKRGSTPRMEYYANKINTPYTYGTRDHARTYQPRPWHSYMDAMGAQLTELTGHSFEVCFLNRYEDQSDHLGWHADDSPEMDDMRPIAIISLGVERDIWFKRQSDEVDRLVKIDPAYRLRSNVMDDEELRLLNKRYAETVKQKLGHGSLYLMPAGFQETHLHRIPKASFQCGRRISLTFRGYV